MLKNPKKMTLKFKIFKFYIFGTHLGIIRDKFMKEKFKFSNFCFWQPTTCQTIVDQSDFRFSRTKLEWIWMVVYVCEDLTGVAWALCARDCRVNVFCFITSIFYSNSLKKQKCLQGSPLVKPIFLYCKSFYFEINHFLI